MLGIVRPTDPPRPAWWASPRPVAARPTLRHASTFASARDATAQGLLREKTLTFTGRADALSPVFCAIADLDPFKARMRIGRRSSLRPIR